MLTLTSQDDNLRLYFIPYPSDLLKGSAFIVIENLPKDESLF